VRRLARYIFNALAVLSLVLCLAVAVLWVRSYWRHYYFRFVSETSQIAPSVGSSKGSIMFIVRNMNFPQIYVEDRYGFVFDSTPAVDLLELSNSLLGICWERETTSNAVYTEVFTRVSIPFAYLVLALSILPGVWTRRWLRRDKISLIGVCRTCAYDLRATPERCPECGTIPPKVNA
jgi:hypothetical protein